jgi:hypothetical protein
MLLKRSAAVSPAKNFGLPSSWVYLTGGITRHSCAGMGDPVMLDERWSQRTTPSPDLRHFQAFSTLRVFFCSQAESTPTHKYPVKGTRDKTQAVGQSSRNGP